MPVNGACGRALFVPETQTRTDDFIDEATAVGLVPIFVNDVCT